MRPIPILLAVVIFVSSIFAQTRDYTRWVNPFIGTGGHGHTFPGATMPFGMVQLSPDTRIDNWDGSSGYHYSDDIIYGFSHTHLSGTGIPDGADILFMPTVGGPQFDAIAGGEWENSYASKFSHANEKAEPGYYSVRLEDQVFAELTATNRVGLHRYTFPKANPPFVNITLNLKWRDKPLDAQIKVASDTRLEGFRRSSSWAKNQTVYFVAEFSKPFKDICGTTAMSTAEIEDVCKYVVGLRFDAKDQTEVLVKVAISYVSIEGARKNLEAELPGWDFDKVRADAKAAWNKELSKIDVSGGTDEQTTNFYSALYHTMIQPNVFNDVDGRYLGHDRKIHQLPGYEVQKPARKQGLNVQLPSKALANARASASEQYTVFSLWDTFRAAHPLYTIIDQKRTVDYINTFIRIYEQGGRLPVWELWGEETDTMIGYHSVSVIADAMAKGIKGFDYDKAYAAAKHSAMMDHHGLAAYKKRGYVSGEDDNESVSKTLEYAYNDWCIMSMGAILFNTRSFATGKKPENDPYLKSLSDDIDYFRRRAGNFENLFDPETRFFRPKRNGGFIKPFAPQEVTFHFTEGNSWQYSFFVPHDVSRLMQLMGGEKKFVEKLDELFTTESKLSGREQPDITGLMGQYAHGNEPSHHIAYLYNYAGEPWETQHRVRKILDEFYKNAPDGLIGNEDCGQMSAWYVLSASGFYPLAPGDKRYNLGAPLFKQVTFNLENGKKFIVRAPNVSSTNFYINSAKWNGQRQAVPYITQDQIASGGVLLLDMTSAPSENAFQYASTSSVYQEGLPVPIVDADRVFKDTTTVSMSSAVPRAEIRYTLDGSEPTRNSLLYAAPFPIGKTTNVKAAAFISSLHPSQIVDATFTKRSNDWTVKLNSEFNSQYPGSSYDAIIDGLRGNQNFAAGEWQGYWGKPFEAVIDLQRETEIAEVGGSFLQSARSWIWMPDRLSFEVSNDAVSYTSIADWKPAFPQTEMNGTPQEFLKTVTPIKARYVRVRAYNIGKIPAWHVGAGGDPWIFVDEIFIR
ncbi:MAG: GH92 family glycosyl hydrolase [Pyrinomonadaceae bacterium]